MPDFGLSMLELTMTHLYMSTVAGHLECVCIFAAKGYRRTATQIP